jgi:hypothetical protein
MVKDMNSGEKSLFDQLDLLEFSEAELALDGLLSEPESSPVPGSKEEIASLERIKSRTLDLIQTEPAPELPAAVRKPRRRAAIGAAAAAILMAAGLLAFSPDAQAGLKQALSFLPGFGTVLESSPGSQLYVLEKPYTVAAGKGELTVNAVLLQENSGTITLRGQQTPVITEFQADIGGDRYTFTSNMRSSASGDWYASYSTALPGNLELETAEPVTLYIHGAAVGPLVLQAPVTADDLQHLGASDVHQEVRITAFPVRLDDGLVRVELVPALPDSFSAVHSYSLEPLVSWNGLYVENAEGVKAKIEPPSTMVYPSEFSFRELASAEEQSYRVVIPYIEIAEQKALSREVVLPLPASGESAPLHITAEIAGYPVEFTRIERSSGTAVSVDVDMNFEPEAAKSLTHFFIRYPGSGDKYSYGWQDTETFPRILKTLLLDAEPGADTLRFRMSEPQFLLKGPWILPLKLED